jgi:hypothetical protein
MRDKKDLKTGLNISNFKDDLMKQSEKYKNEQLGMLD